MDIAHLPFPFTGIPGLFGAVCRLPTTGAAPDELYRSLCIAFPDAAGQDYLRQLIRGVATAPSRLTALSLLPPLLRSAGQDPRGYTLARDGHGRPYLRPPDPDRPAPDFNLSHSARHAVCVLWCGHGRVGVDIEEPIPAPRAERLKGRVCSSRELALLPDHLGPNALSAEFTRIWTRKEALCKQDGRGQPLLFDSELPSEGLCLFSAVLADTGAILSLCWPQT